MRLHNGAAKESNLPTRGLHGPAGFEDRMGHQTLAAPGLIIRILDALRVTVLRTTDLES
jgi:hypothetical protein